MYQILNHNFSWMTFNILLALIPVFLGWLLYSEKNKILKASIFIAWLLFVPNTIYVFTDILHFIRIINKVTPFLAVIATLQYAVLFMVGFLTYIFSLYPIDKMLKSPRYIIGINFLIGFGIVLGRVHRLNSWDIIVEIEKVGSAALQIISSPSMISLTILFGLFANFLYFLFKKQTINIYIKKFDKTLYIAFNKDTGKSICKQKKGQSP